MLLGLRRDILLGRHVLLGRTIHMELKRDTLLLKLPLSVVLRFGTLLLVRTQQTMST